MMRLLFELDRKDYRQCTRTYVRNSARSIIISGGKIAMVHSLKTVYPKVHRSEDSYRNEPEG